jgi:CMP-N-acetylneuraminic acid synthetase
VNAAIVTARKGSKSIRDKNVYEVLGRPLIEYPIQAALDAQRIDGVYVSTDGEAIAECASSLGCEIIWRPDDLVDDHVNHGDVIKHAVEWVDEREKDLRNVVLLLGNTVMVDGELIDEALAMLDAQPDLDSVMSVWEAADDHPLRALEIHDGVLRPFGGADRQVSTERQSYSKAYYYDQGVWAFRKEGVQRREGPSPWWWMGKRSAPIIRPWVTGRDVHTYLDVSVAEWWLQHQVAKDVRDDAARPLAATDKSAAR